MKKTRRPQAPKTRSAVTVDAILRSGAGIHDSKKNYSRKVKHKNREEW